MVLLCAVLLALRKPWALHTPQLWAEDGTIFLAQNDVLGLRAAVEPYMGYLHLLPRLVAWLAAQLADPRWWPAIYNGAAFAASLAVIARLFSPRLALPGAPWLALSFFLGPQTGEVLITITNAQWFTAFFLVQQALIARPTNATERAIDLSLLVLAGLTGPFVIAFWPLLAWRWWRDRHADNLVVLLLATACAAVQAWFVWRTGPRFEYPPFALEKFCAAVGQHLLVWPAFGTNLAIKFSPLVLALIGFLPVLALLAWALRPHERRRSRAPIVAAFVLILGASVYRCRPDTWNLQALFFGERYFFIPRILLAWLLIWEIGAAPRWVSRAAAALLLVCALVHLRGYSLGAPGDYKWAEHVDPIRRGVPTNIPTLPDGWMMEYQGRPARP
ncbi:MAG: hypothetical protein HZA93_26740 [Verrucomicrobia bacterium]|nr:hypothetical protein [Verrucomicrobiota bacterium]